MRKRSEVKAPAAAPVQDVSPVTPQPVETSPGLPPRVTVNGQLWFITCPNPTCKLQQTKESAVDGGRCVRCQAVLDPDAKILEWEQRTGAPGVVPLPNAAPGKAQGSPLEAAPKATPIEPPPASSERKAGGQKCAVCGKALTETALGPFYPCGHDFDAKKQAEAPQPVQPTPVPPPPTHSVAIPPIAPSSPIPPIPSILPPERDTRPETPTAKREAQARETVGDRLTMTFGEELFTPVPFNSFRVGPFTLETTLQPGETAQQAHARLVELHAGVVEAEFVRRLHDYLRRLNLVQKAVNGQ